MVGRQRFAGGDILNFDERDGYQARTTQSTDRFGHEPLVVTLGDHDDRLSTLGIQFVRSLGQEVVLDDAVERLRLGFDRLGGHRGPDEQRRGGGDGGGMQPRGRGPRGEAAGGHGMGMGGIRAGGRGLGQDGGGLGLLAAEELEAVLGDDAAGAAGRVGGLEPAAEMVVALADDVEEVAPLERQLDDPAGLVGGDGPDDERRGLADRAGVGGAAGIGGERGEGLGGGVLEALLEDRRGRALTIVGRSGRGGGADAVLVLVERAPEDLHGRGRRGWSSLSGWAGLGWAGLGEVEAGSHGWARLARLRPVGRRAGSGGADGHRVQSSLDSRLTSGRAVKRERVMGGGRGGRGGERC